MIAKTKGAEDSCPSCKQTLVCREITYKDQKKLQWQYKDKEVAHFSFDFKTGKTSCKESATGFAETRVQHSAQNELNISGIDLPQKEKEGIMKATEELTDRMLIVLSGVTRKCAAAGITHPATIGMIFNQVCETRRSTI